MKTKVLLITTLLCAVVVNAQTFTDNFIEYEVISSTNNTVKTIDYDTNGGTAVTIPSTVSNGGVTYDVVEINFLSFSNKQLTSVTIPNSITTIGFQAFSFNNLTNALNATNWCILDISIP